MGVFVVLEGIDGSGKTTIAGMLAGRLREMGYTVVLTGEPTQGPVGRLIREYLMRVGERDLVMEALLFAADRRWHVKNVIEPALRRADYVICDRYVYSSYAYQVGDETPLEWLMEINRGIPDPDHVIFLDVDPEICMSRLGGPKTGFERALDLREVYENYLRISSMCGFRVVDARRRPEEVLSEVLKIVL